jgi:hypothetical protein
MSDGDKPSDGLAALTNRLKRDLDTGTQTAKVLWKTTLAPGLRDIGTKVREGSGKATEQASDVFVGIGRRLRDIGGRLKDR